MVKGADFITAMVFMVASTNLVIEIGLVLIALMGWQFAVAEFVGGPIMIVLLALLGTLLFPAVGPGLHSNGCNAKATPQAARLQQLNHR